VEIFGFKGDALALKALLAGELDSYEGNPGGPMIAAAKGADVKIVGCHWPGLTYAIYTKPGIESVAALKGKTFAVSQPNALPDLLAKAVLREAGIAPAEVKLVIAGSDADRIRSVAAGIADAATSSSEFLGRARELGLKMLVHARDAVPNYMRYCLIMRGDKIAKELNAATRMVAAEMDAYKHLLSHRAETIALSHRIIGAKAEDTAAADIYDEVIRYNAVSPTFDIDRAKLIWLRDLLAYTGNIDAKFDPGRMIDTSPRDAALALVGQTN